ncbi:MAG: endonuclease/exonuclease/phosphatase family protein [Planctomycetota bacterium]|nr:endonuclease/exonuclease/phosphatase family protein [Planctomycetota bacterium]
MRVRIACLCICLLGSFAERTAAEDAFTVMSYNIRYLNTRDGEDVWGNRKEAVIDSFEAGSVVGLQEVVWNQFDDIKSATPKLEWYGVARDDGKQKGESAPIGWRKTEFYCIDKGTFWLSENPKTVGSKGWDAALPRIATWVRLQDNSSKLEWIILNTHFDHRGSAARKKSGELIRNWVAENAKGLPVVVMGDMNAKLGSAPMNALLEGKEAALEDARSREGVRDKGPNSTWCGFREIVEGQRIDHILVSQNVAVVAFETMNPKTKSGRFASDHLPVWCRLKLAEQK